MESIYPRKRDVPRGFLEAVAGDTQRQNESKRVEEVVSAGSIENDLVKAIEVMTALVHPSRLLIPFRSARTQHSP